MKRLKFTLVIHDHQPVGNFDSVIERLTRQCYRPFLESLKKYPTIPFNLHLSGPLLRWWEGHDSPMLDLVGEMIDAGQIEILMGGFYEPVLASIPSEDRRGQLSIMREYLRGRFGIDPRGLWLTERVWDSEVVKDLVADGIRYLLVDDRHFKVAGYEEKELKGYYLTESGGESIAIFPIDERLRYLIPFRSVEELSAYLRELQAGGGAVAVYGDDGEKMGGWPGTADWVYRDGWLARFLEALQAMKDEFLDILTCTRVMEEEKPLGLCYLPTASYREMEGWSLPAERLLALEKLVNRLGDSFEGYQPFVRGGHWRNFLVKYPESNLLHKKVLRLSHLLRRRKVVPPKVVEELYASQCNDAYWHGVFGGLYLPHLRGAVWERISRVEKYLRMGENLAVEELDFDMDGRREVWAHSFSFSAVVRPERGGQIAEWTYFPHDNNYGNVLARRFEAYHQVMRRTTGASDQAGGEGHGEGKASIHDLWKRVPPEVLDELFYDRTPRGLFVDRFFDGKGDLDAYRKSELVEYGHFAGGEYRWKAGKGRLVMDREEAIPIGSRLVRLAIRKEMTFSPEGGMDLLVQVESAQAPEGLFYGTELSLFPPHLFRGYGRTFVDGKELESESTPRSFGEGHSLLFRQENSPTALKIEWSPVSSLWFYPIFTVSQSESGFEKTLQGLTFLPYWPLPAGADGRIEVQFGLRFEEP